MNQTNDGMLQLAITGFGLKFSVKPNHIIAHTGDSHRPPAVGFRLIGSVIASAFLTETGKASNAAHLAGCLNPSMPVGAWTVEEGSSCLRYNCRLPIPGDPNKHLRFFGSFVRRQAELIVASCHVIEAAQAGQNPQQVIATAMRRLQPMSESLPPDQRITPCQWQRALKALRIDSAEHIGGCQKA